MSENIKNKAVGRAALTEPVIVSGKCFGIKLLSIYDFMLCTKMLQELTEELMSQAFDKKLCLNICEKACLVAMCLYDSKGQKIFKDGFSVLKSLTPDELYFLYQEYIKLQKKILKRDKITYSILENVKKHGYKKLLENSKSLFSAQKNRIKNY